MKLMKSAVGAALAACLGVTVVPAAHAGTAFVHLFEWSWNDIANECEQFLGPKGFEAVQISPPYEHIDYYTWWARYQPVSYQLVSRSGNRQELQNMVNRCHAAGVKVYADMVINHTAKLNDGGVGTAGTPWSYKNTVDYSPQDYHNTCLINDYGNAWEVHNCELSYLPDLNTSSNYVQNKLAGYFNDLKSIGIDGFRIDAAKHMSPSDVQSILAKAGNPYSFLEVIGAAGEAVQPDQYTHIAQVTEFKYGPDLAGNFNNQIRWLKTLGPSWGLLNSSDAIVFVDNHDRERGHGGGGNLTYKDGAKYNLANVFMLAYPYGYPRIHSGYEFHDENQGPPAGGGCANSSWICQHRWGNIANMVGFRNFTVGAWSVDNWWDNGNNQIAFGRGDKGFVVINNEGGSLNRTFNTGLPAGEYCNVLSNDDPCGGTTITVDSNGYANFNVAGMSAAAIHGGKKADGGSLAKNFSSLYFRGTPNGWGTTAMTLVANNTWQASVTFDGQANQRFKVDVYGDWSYNFGDNNGDGVLDQTGNDIYTNVSGNYVVTVNDNTMTYTISPAN